MPVDVWLLVLINILLLVVLHARFPMLFDALLLVLINAWSLVLFHACFPVPFGRNKVL